MTKITADEALKLGVEAHKAGNLAEADRLYTAIINADPKNPDANHNMGVLAVSVGKINEALDFFQVAIETRSSTLQFWLSYLDALIKLKKLDKAKALLEKAKQSDLNYSQFGELQKKLNAVSNVDMNTSAEEFISNASELKEKGMIDEAIHSLQKITKKIPDNAEMLALLAHCFML